MANSSTLALDEGHFRSSHRQQKHRHDLIDAWLALASVNDTSAAHDPWHSILEVGCGQGDQTAALAKRFPNSVITAIDPASPDYGTPTTLGESQAALKATTWGAHITFKQSDAISFCAPSPHPTLESTPSLAILSHCTWYFSSPHLLTQTFLALKKQGIPNLALAEWDISSRPAQPAATALHLHAVLLQSLPAALKNTQANIRCPFTPRAIQQAALEAGWKLRNETVLRSPELEDAQWELYAARAAGTNMREAQLTNGDRIALDAHEAVLQAAAAHWEASRPSADALPACLDVWVAWFE